MTISNTPKRLIRLKNAPEFFGVGRGFFDEFIRPSLTEIWLGDSPKSGIVFDVYDLHAHADIMKERNGRPAKRGEELWDVNQKVLVLKLSKDSDLPTGISTEPSTEGELDKVLEQTMRRQQK